MTDLGRYIGERREAKNWSIRRLAQEAGISHTEVHRIEAGERKNPSFKTLQALAQALDIPQKEVYKMAGYMEEDPGLSPIEKAFPALKKPKQQETVQKIVDGLARNQDLEDQDYEDLVKQMEMFLTYAKQKKDRP